MTPRLTLINREYTRLWLGQAVSSLGDMVFSTTLVLWVATELAENETWAPSAVGGVLVAGGTAVLFVGPVAGVFVDRWDKRRTMLATEVVRGGLVALLTAVSFLPTSALPAGVWLALVYATVLVLHAAARFFTPARFTVIADVVTGDADRARAAGITQATSQATLIVGPPLAAPLFFALGVQWALLFNALSYLVSYLAIRAVRVPGRAEATVDTGEEPTEKGSSGNGPAGHRTGVLPELMAGVRFFARSRFLVALLGFAVIGQFGVGALNTLNIFFTTENLHASAHLYGYIGMAIGAGGIVGALCAGRVVQWIGAWRTTWIGLLVSGVLMVVYSRQSGFVGGVVLLVLIIIPITMLNTAMAPLLLGAAPARLRGRVVAVFQPVTQLAAMLAAALSGWLAGTVLLGFEASVAGIRFGPIDTIFAVSGLIVLLAGVYARMALPDTGSAESGEAPGADREAVRNTGRKARNEAVRDAEEAEVVAHRTDEGEESATTPRGSTE